LEKVCTKNDPACLISLAESKARTFDRVIWTHFTTPTPRP
jgi:hypothetical protein